MQSPKGDISYMQKFFLMYAGGRLPLHLQEDFCGTALLRYILGLLFFRVYDKLLKNITYWNAHVENNAQDAVANW
jgi:hypothetical protein